MLQSFSRVIKSGFANFKRNSLLTVSSVGIMALTLAVLLLLILVSYGGRVTIKFLEDKINFSLYFKPDTLEAEIKNIQKEIGSLPQVRNIDYVSQDEALESFKQRHEKDPTLSEALEALGHNPFAASLNIQAQKPKDFEAIYTYVENASFRNLIEKITYYENQDIIRRVNIIVNSFERGGIVLGAILILLAALVTYNTIRIAIYSQREEISVMKLVGASDWFIRGPFIITGILYSIIAALIVFVVAMPLLYWSAPYFKSLVGSFDPWQYFMTHAALFACVLLGSGILIGSISSTLALNKYLKV